MTIPKNNKTDIPIIGINSMNGVLIYIKYDIKPINKNINII